MSSFTNLLSRAAFLNEAKGIKGEKNIKRNLPGPIVNVYKQASGIAKEKGGIPTREGKNAVISIIAGLVELKIGRSLTIAEERELTSFKNQSGQEPFINYLETAGPQGHPKYADILKDITEEDVAAVNESRRRETSDIVGFQMAQRSEERQEKYNTVAAERQLKAQEREQLKQMKKAAAVSGNHDLVDTLTVIDSGLAKGIELAGAGQIQAAVEEVLDLFTDEVLESEKGKYNTSMLLKAINNVREYVEKHINTIDQLKAFITRIFKMEEYGEIALHLSAALKSITSQQDTQNKERNEEDAEDVIGDSASSDFDRLAAEYSEGAKLRPEVLEAQKKAVMKALGGNTTAKPVTENTTSFYLSDQIKKDRYTNIINEKTVSFKEKFKPKTLKQLAELRNYGL